MDQILGGLFERAVAFAGGRIAMDDAAGRIGRVLGDAGQRQRPRIHQREMTDRQAHRIIRRRPVQFFAGEEALLRELRDRMPLSATNPASLRRLRRLFGYARERLRDRADIAELDGVLQ